jgi:NADH-quinone oxidoreductase subunit J
VSLQEVIFAVLGLIGIGAALRLVTAKNVVHAALYLVVALGTVAGVFLLLAAEFVAWVQILIYVGAIVVLLLFSLMLTRAPIGREALDNQQRVMAAVVAIIVVAGLAFLIQEAFGGLPPVTLERAQMARMGVQLFSTFVLPFEVVSYLLLAALVGAIVLARRDER